MNLRPYQQHGVAAILEAFKDDRSTLAVMPTGTGKTVVFAHVINQMPEGRVMVLAHREELVRQAADKIHAVTGEACDIELAEQRADGGLWRRARTVVSSIQTQCAGDPERMTRFDPFDFGLVVVDEAHHAPADTYKKVLQHYQRNPRLRVLGVTATPDRSDEKALGQVFGSAAFVYEITDAIQDGYLVPIRQRSVSVVGLDYSGVRTTAGDLNQADVARAQGGEDKIHGFVSPIIEIAGDRKTLVFATPSNAADGCNYRISERITEVFNRHRPECARLVDQRTPKDVRRQLIADYADGRFQFLVNVGVFTEGFDEPGIEVVAITRPTKSRALFAQMIGRGTRPLPGLVDFVGEAHERRAVIAASRKPYLEVVDFEGNAGKHKLCHTADVLGGNCDEQTVARAVAIAKENGGDIMDAIASAAREAEEEQAKQCRLHIVAKATFVTDDIDPFDTLDVPVPFVRGWDAAELTEAQIAVLRRNGVRTEGMVRKQASVIIGEIKRRQASGIAGFKLAARLRAMGLPHNVSVGDALNSLARTRRQ